MSTSLKEPSTSPILSGYEVIDSGGAGGYAAIYSIQHDPETGEAFGVATSAGANR